MSDQPYSVEWLENEAILQVTFHRSFANNQEVDTFYDDFTSYIQAWKAEKPHLLLFDISAPTPIFSNYIRRRAEELSKSTPPYLKGRSAIIVKPSILVAIFRVFIELGVNRLNPNVRGKVFYSHADGLAWLKELLTEDTH